MNTPMGLVKAFTAETAIAKRRIVSFGSDDGAVIQSTSDAGVLGVSGIRGAEAGAHVDVYLSDIQDVEFGAAISSGQYVTADADGKGTPASGAGTHVVGRALESGGAGAICKVLIQPQQIAS